MEISDFLIRQFIKNHSSNVCVCDTIIIYKQGEKINISDFEQMLF